MKYTTKKRYVEHTERNNNNFDNSLNYNTNYQLITGFHKHMLENL